MNKSQVMFINAMYLYIAPQLMQATKVFADMDDILENAMTSFLNAIHNQQDNDELKSVFDDKLDSLVDDIMLKIQLSFDEVLEHYGDDLRNLVLKTKLIPAFNCISHFSKNSPSLTPLDKPILRQDLITYLSYVKQKDGINSNALNEYVSCFQSIFDELDEKHQQQQRDEQILKSWFDAVENNDINSIKTIIDSGIDIDIENDHRKTALAIATINNNIELAKLLLSNKANPKQLHDDDSPVYLAMENSCTDVLKVIINDYRECLDEQEWYNSIQKYTRDKNIDIFKLLLKSPLVEVDLIPIAQQAIQGNYSLILNYLFESGLDANASNSTEPLIFVALTSCNIAALQLFIDNGVNINTVNYLKQTLLESALVNSSELMIEYLISQGITFDVEPFDWLNVIGYIKKMSVLMSWTFYDCLEIVVSDIKKIDVNGWNLLHTIVSKRNTNAKQVQEIIEICEFLINDIEIDINQLTEDKEHSAITLTHSESIFDYLLQKQPDLNIEYFNEEILLQKMLDKFEGRAFKKLISSNVNLDVKIEGSPLLHYVYSHNSKQISNLVEQGCDINVKDNNGFSILQNTISNTQVFERDLLMFAKLGADFNLCTPNQTPILHVLCALYDVEIVKEIFSINTIDIHVYDSNDNNATMQASLAGNTPNVILLAHAGVDVNHKNSIGSTPLLHAVYNDDVDLVKCLINHCDADISIELAGKNIIELAKLFYSQKVLLFLMKHKELNRIS